MGDDELEKHVDGFTTQGTMRENPFATGAERRGQETAETLERVRGVGQSGTSYDWMSTLGSFGILVLVLGLAALFVWLT